MFINIGINKFAFLFLIFSILLAGCSGMQIDPNNPRRWLIKYESTPSGAEVYEGNMLIGLTPFSVSIPLAGRGKGGEREVAVLNPCGKEYTIKHTGWALDVKINFNSNKAIIREYPTGLSLTAVTREINLEEKSTDTIGKETNSIRCFISANDISGLEKYIQSGGDINKQFKSGFSPIIYAILKNKEQVVSIFLKNSANPNIVSDNGVTPLILSTVGGKINITEKLLQAGADPNLRNHTGTTPLILASSKGYIDIVKLLLDHGADPTLAQNDGVTALTTTNDPTIYNIIKNAISGGYSGSTQQPIARSPREPATYTGTGWVTKGGYIVTNYHVIENHIDIKVRFNSLSDKQYSAKAVISDKHNDLAILKLEKHPERNKIPGLIISSTGGKIGQDVFTLGYPKASVMGKNPKITNGIISALSGLEDDPRVLQTTVAIQGGNSGGPLMDMNGKVIAVTTSSLRIKVTKQGIDVPQSVNYAVKSAYIKALLTSLPIDKNYPMVKISSHKLVNIIPQVKNSIAPIIVHARK